MNSALPIVYIVDDDSAVRESLGWLVASANLETSAFASAEAFLKAYDRSRPACLVLDLRMPGMSGLELQERLVRDRVDVPTIIVTGYGEVPTAVRAMRAGAVDFLEKPYRDEQILACIRTSIWRDIRARTSAQRIQKLRSQVRDLTPRESQVMKRVVRGMANKQIASDLKVTEKTVEFHRGRVMKKFGIKSVAELVRIALITDKLAEEHGKHLV